MDDLRQCRRDIAVRSELGHEHTKLSEEIEDVDEHSHYVSDDVTFNGKKRIEVCEEKPDSDEENLTYDANFDELNPGEVEETSLFDKTLPIKHKTRLDFAGLSPRPGDNSSSNSMNDCEVSFCPTKTTIFMGNDHLKKIYSKKGSYLKFKILLLQQS